MKRTILILSALGGFAGISAAQTASALVHEGDLLVGAPTGQLITGFNSTAANQNGGFAATVSSSDGTTTLSHVWGSADGTAPGILWTEATVGVLVQTSLESFFGVADSGSVAYSASGTGGPVGSFDSVWLDATPLAVEGDPILTLPGEFWRFASRPGVTAGGIPYFVGGITSVSGGSTEDYGLFYGLNPTVVLRGGDVLPNLPEPLSTSSTISFDYRYSANGSHFIAEVHLAGPTITTSNDYAMVIDSAGLVLGGSLVQEGTLVPVSIGGDGVEAWANFDTCGITEGGSYAFAGDTSGNVATDEFIVVDGVIAYREGDVVDGETLTGSIEAISLNEVGVLVYVWDVVVGTSDKEALFAGDTLLLAEGDAVDWDGDGVIDPSYTITDFTGTAALSIGADSVIYFTADVDDGTGTVLEGLFALQGPGGPMTVYCPGDGSGTPCPCANDGDGSQGVAGCANGVFASGAQLTGSGTPSLSNDTVVLHGAFTEPNNSGLYFQANNDLSPGILWGDGLQCAGGALKRLQVRFADASGSSSTTIGISAKAGNIVAGDTKYYQLWYRNPLNPPCGTGVNDFNSTNGLAITWAP